MGCVLDVIKGESASIKRGHPERVGGIPTFQSIFASSREVNLPFNYLEVLIGLIRQVNLIH